MAGVPTKAERAAPWRSTAERALARHPRAPRKPRRRLLDLLEAVQMAVGRTLEGSHAADLEAAHAELCRGSPGRVLLCSCALAPPVEQRAAQSQQRRSVLEHHGLWADGA